MKTRLLALAAAIATVLLSGCVVVPDHSHYHGGYSGGYNYHHDGDGRRGEDRSY